MYPRALLCALALGLAACAADDASPVGAEDVDADIFVEMLDMGYEPERITVPEGERITVALHNAGPLRHDLVLPDGTSSDVLNADERTVVEIGPLHESVTAWCSIPGHRNAGMELDIDVE